MIELKCDMCGGTVSSGLYDILISEINHVHPRSYKDDAPVGITGGHGADYQLRFCVCTKCYRDKLKLPNIHLSTDTTIQWRDKK